MFVCHVRQTLPPMLNSAPARCCCGIRLESEEKVELWRAERVSSKLSQAEVNTGFAFFHQALHRFDQFLGGDESNGNDRVVMLENAQRESSDVDRLDLCPLKALVLNLKVFWRRPVHPLSSSQSGSLGKTGQNFFHFTEFLNGRSDSSW